MTRALSIVLGPHGQVQDLRSGAVPVAGYELAFTEVKRMPDAYRDMARTQPYEVCEMAPTAYLMALAAGAPLTALPIPMTRRFRHAGVQRRADSAVGGPADLAGRTVGVRNYSVTAAVWTRGVYADEFGLDPKSVTWLTEEPDHVAGFQPPANVQRVPPGQSLAAMLKAGELEVAFAGLAGAGNDDSVELVELVPDAAAREADWFMRTGIYPLHGVIVVRNDVLQRDPGLPLALWDAFNAAKQNYLARVQAVGAAAEDDDKRYLQLQALVGDPLPYGLAENAKSLQALVRYAHQQGLIARQPAIENVFVDPREGVARAATWEQ